MKTGATQQSPTASPKVTVTIDSDVYKTEGAGGDERVVKVQAGEEIWGGLYIIELDNSDNALDSKDYEGEDLTLNFGFTDESGSDLHDLFVDRQEFISREGELRLQLVCYDNWAKLSFFTASLGGSLWNYPQQSMAKLDEVTLPSGEELPQDLKDAINAQYGQIIGQIVTKVLSDTLGKSPPTGTGDNKYYSEKPQVNAMDARNTIAQALSACMSYLKLDGDSFKIINMTSPSTAYSYNVANLFFENLTGEAIVVPNTIVFHGMTSAGALVQTDTAGGHGVNATSVSRLGTIYEHHFMDWSEIENLTTQNEVDDRADARITRLEIGLSVGTLIAPMHCSQELFDKVSITDDRYDTPKTVTGIVFGILREYDRGVYRITLTLGGVEGGYTPDGGEDYKAVPRPDYPAIPPSAWNLPRAIQGYHHDIHFTASDWDTITWTGGGTIKFYDGTTQNINTGSYNLPDGAIRYIYFDLADATPQVLKVTTDYTSVMTMDTGLLCLVQRSSDTGIKANVIPSYGKEPLISCDFIDMTGLVNYDLGGGEYLQGILNTQISAGRIYLSSETWYATGYDPSEALAAAEAAQAAAEAAQSDATDALADLSDIADDAKVVPSEKLQAKRFWNNIGNEKPGIDATADSFSVSRTAYDNAYNALNTYLNTTLDVFGDMDATTNITRSTWNTKWDNYYDEKVKLLNAIAEEAKDRADAAQATANNALAIADGEIIGFYQDDEPVSGMSFGDIWIDTNKTSPPDATCIYRYEDVDGGSQGALDWRLAPNDAIGKVYLDVYGAQATADGKITTFYASSAPSAEGVGDLWVDTAHENRLKRWNGSNWITVRDTDIAQALADAADASSAAADALAEAMEKFDLDDDDADDIKAGGTWSVVRKHDLYNGYLNLTSEFRIDGETQATVGVYIDAEDGITIKGGKLVLKDANGAHSGVLYIDTNGHLKINDWSVTICGAIRPPTNNSGEVGDASYHYWHGYFQYLFVSGGLYLPKITSQPGGADGLLVYDSSDGHLKYYSAHDSQWFRVQRTGGWG